MIYRITIFFVFVTSFWIRTKAQQNITQAQTIIPIIDSIAQIEALSVEDQTTEGNRFNNIVPPSPEIAQFQKYIDYPIDYTTGVPHISIPLYEINTGKLRLPITLTYHASGFKVDDQSGIVGLGWSLNTGGLVSRKIVNAPDENSSFPYPYRTPTNMLNQAVADDFLYIGNMFYLGPEYTSVTDGEYDVFYYSAGLLSGKFLLAGNGYMNRKIVTIPYEPIKITTDCNFNSHTLINYFEITDTKGDIYRYGKSSIDGSMATEVNDEYNTYADAWFLREIYSADSTEHIRLYYSELQRFNRHRTDIISYFDNGVLSSCPEEYSCSIQEGGQYSYDFGNGYTYSSPKLSRIEFKGGTIDFSYVNDVLKTMVVKDTDGNIIKKIIFQQAPYPNTLDTDLFKLTSMYTEDKNGNIGEKYSFDYNESVNIPEYGVYTTPGVDYWGYYNGKTNNANIIPPLEIYMSGRLDPLSYADRETYEDKMQVFILKKITFPTGGTTEYEYEANKANDNNVGGLRVKKITSKSTPLDTPIIIRYKYGLNEDGNGKLLQNPYTVNAFMDLSESHPECIYVNPYDPYTEYYCSQYFRKRTFSSDMFDGGNLNSGCPVFYEQIAEYQGSTENNTNGKSVFIYEPPRLNQYYIGTHIYTDIYDEWQTNHLLRRTDYKWEGTVFDTVQTTEYNYTIREDEPLKCSKVMLKQQNIMVNGQSLAPTVQTLWSYFYASVTPYSMFGGGPGTINPDAPGASYQDSNGKVYNIVEYEYKTGAKHLDQVRTTQYLDGREFVTIEDYDYGDYLNDPVSKTTSKSDGSTSITHLKYPHDYSSTLNSMSILLNKNIISAPIDTRTYNGGQLVSGNQIEYDSNGLPIKTYVMDRNADDPDIPFDTNDPFTFSYKAGYSYNSGKRLQQFSPVDNNNSSYIWAYGNSYPVVKAENVDYNTLKAAVEAASGTTDLEAFWGNLTTVIYDNSTWSSFNNSLRNNAALKDAMVTTYTYKPLVGMTSETDPAGRTLYYEYDSFGRLKLVRDQNGNIVKKHEYHYAGQSN